MDPQEHPQNAHEWAHHYVEAEGFSVLPAPLLEKEAKIEGWPERKVTLEEIEELFPPGELKNVVRINGDVSGGAGDLDLDCPEALAVVRHIVPGYENELRKFGREGQAPGHIDVMFEDEAPRTRRFSVPGDDGRENMIVELRANGSQTLLPPSLYPEDERCVLYPGKPITAHAVTLTEIAEEIAAAALVLRNYPGTGARDEYMMGVIGLLVKNKVGIDRIRRIVKAAGRVAKDDELAKRDQLIDRTFTKWTKTGNVSGRKKLRKFDKHMADSLEEWLGERLGLDSGLPTIFVTNRALRDCSDAATDALVAANEPPELFSRSGSLTRLSENSDGKPVLQLVDKDRMRWRITRVAEFVKITKQGPELCFPPTEVVGDVMAARGYAFPELTGITEVPVLRKSGTVVDHPGYDAESQLIFAPDEDLKYSVPEVPTPGQMQSSLALLKETIVDFPFVDEASAANCLALFITPAVRPVFDSTIPLTVIDKPRIGTGASLIAECVSLIYSGERFHPNAMPSHSEEARKQITSILITGRPVIVFDNVTEEIGGSAYAALFTSTHWSDRILGHSKIVDLPNRSIWIATGNNVQVNKELGRRCQWIRMDAQIARPWERDNSQFTHPNLLKWVLEKRGEIVSAVLTLARHWFVEGATDWSGNPLGSFEAWSKTIGGILEAAGVQGFLANYQDQMDRADDDSGEWEAFLNAWADKLGTGTKLKGRKVIEFMKQEEAEEGEVPLRDLLPAELILPFSQDDPLISNLFGKALGKVENVRHGDNNVHVKSPSASKGTKTWQVLRDEEGPEDKPENSHPSPQELQPQDTQSGPAGVGEVGWVGYPTSPVYSESSQQKDTKELRDASKGVIELQAGTISANGRSGSTTQPTPPTPPTPDNVVEMFPVGGHGYTYVTTEPVLKKCIEHIEKADVVAGDIETTGKDWWSDTIRVLSLTSGGKTFVVDVAAVDAAPLYRVLEKKHLVFHHAAFDVPFLRRAGCNPRRVSCTMILSQLLHAGREGIKHSLEAVVERYAPAHADEVKAVDIDHGVWKEDKLPEDALEYAAGDTRALLDVLAGELSALEDTDLGDVADLEEKFLSVVIEVTATGMPVDPERWSEVVEETKVRKRELGEQLDRMLPAGAEIPEKFVSANSDKPEVGKINWSSPEQKVWAVEALGLDVPRRWDYKTKSEKKTLNKVYLYLLDHPIAEGLRVYQAIANFPATYARALRERFHAEQGRMYAEWKQLEARTGRMSCCNPPMHNIPKKTKLREAIVAPEGYKIVTLDFSQIEPRILAAVSRDAELLKAFRRGDDIYRFVAQKVTGTPMDKVTGDLRAVFKTIVLGMIYGMGPVGLTLRIHRDIDPNMPEEQISDYYYGFFDAFPGAKKWRENLEEEFEAGSRETRTVLGRRRLDVENKRQRWNAPIQGAATDAFRAAAAALVKERAQVARRNSSGLYESFKIIALIHDEVVLEVHADQVEEVETWAGEVMATAAAGIVNAGLPKKLHIETEVDSGAGATLQEAKDAA